MSESAENRMDRNLGDVERQGAGGSGGVLQNREGSQHEEQIDSNSEEDEIQGSREGWPATEKSDGNENEDSETPKDFLEDVDLHSLTPEEFKNLKFRSSEWAYAFYNEYGRVKGFGIRRSRIGRNKRNEIIWVKFVCNRQGVREDKYLKCESRKRDPRPLSRCGCEAHLVVRLELCTGSWYVGNFFDDHNHVLVGQRQKGLARSHRKMTDADIVQLYTMRKSGICTPLIYGSFAMQSGGIDKVGFGLRQAYNQLVKERRLAGPEFIGALKYLKNLQNYNPGFYWKHALAEDGSWLKLFWCDAASQLDYELFGDVLAFDATYNKNKYKMPVVVFSGVNHHNQTCVFATAIVSNESEETYVWLLKEFLEAMKGKCPKKIITDGDLAMRNAIRSVFPDAHHCLCGWHLLRNATANVKKPYFTKMLKDCMLGDYDVNEFEEKWKDLVEQCGLQDNSWVLELYSKKTMWATAHIRGKFFGGLRTTSRCEGLHALIGRYVKHGYNFVEFLEQFDRCLERIRNNEIEADYISQHTEPVLKTEFQALESYAAKVYTRVIFKMFQEVLLNSSKVPILEVKESPSAKIFIVGKYCTPNVKWNVAFYSLLKEFRCSCQRMESFGIPCSHILSAMIQLHMRQIPKSLVLDRWSKGIKEGVAERFGQGGARAEAEMNVLKYGGLVQGCREICRLACFSNDDYAEVKNFIENTRVRLKRKHRHRVTNTVDLSQISVIGSSTQAASETLPLSEAVTNTTNGQRPCVGRPRRKKLQKCTVCRRMGHNHATCPIGIVLEKHLQSMGFDNQNEGSDEDEDNEEGMNLADG